MASSDELVFAPLGGVGEIGMNLSLYGLGREGARKWIAVDLGVAFAGDDLPGIDLIMPDIRYLLEERHNLLGLVLTHAHEDHFGAVLDLWPRLRVPVYATPFTAALFDAKRLAEPGAPDVPINVVRLGARFNLGGFDIELVSMSHSIPESNGLIIRTPLGTVLHTGDWKLDPTPVIGPATDEPKLRALGEALGLEQRGGEGRGVDRHAQARPQVEDGAEMVLVRVGEHEGEKIVPLVEQTADVRHDQVDAGQIVAREGDAEVDREPLARILAAEAVEREVHADLAHAAEGREDELVRGCSHALVSRFRSSQALAAASERTSESRGH